MIRPGACVMFLGVATACAAVGQDDSEEKFHYLRWVPDRTATECEFTIERGKGGWSIVSVTGRGETKLTVKATYDADDRLTAAEATLMRGESRKAATVEVVRSKATVRRAEQVVQEFEVPRGVIVTSAPDWTDTFLLCRRGDRRRGGKQEFAGLWIHPEQPAQRLTFSIERLGTDTLEHNGKKIELGRFEIRLRGNSPYAAWADAKGTMIRLIPLPYKEGTVTGLVLEGYESSAGKLQPAKSQGPLESAD